MKKHSNSVVTDKYFPSIQKGCEARVTYTLLYIIFQVFKDEKCPNKNIYHNLTLFSEKIEECAAGKQPANCINKTKRGIKVKFNDLEKEYLAFSEFHLEKLGRFVGDSCQKLGVVKDVLAYFENYINAFAFNGSFCQIDMDMVIEST